MIRVVFKLANFIGGSLLLVFCLKILGGGRDL